MTPIPQKIREIIPFLRAMDCALRGKPYARPIVLPLLRQPESAQGFYRLYVEADSPLRMWLGRKYESLSMVENDPVKMAAATFSFHPDSAGILRKAIENKTGPNPQEPKKPTFREIRGAVRMHFRHIAAPQSIVSLLDLRVDPKLRTQEETRREAAIAVCIADKNKDAKKLGVAQEMTIFRNAVEGLQTGWDMKDHEWDGMQRDAARRFVQNRWLKHHMGL